MGHIAFQTPNRDCLTEQVVERAYLVGYDGVPIPSRNLVKDDVLIINRQVDESGYLQIPWEVEDYAQLMLSTASLMATPEPYLLDLELARGTLNRLRNHIAAGQLSEFEIPAETENLLAEAIQLFSDSLVARHSLEECAGHSRSVISKSLKAVSHLVNSYGTQAVQRISQQGNTVEKLFGVRVSHELSNDSVQSLATGCNSLAVTTRWSDVEAKSGEANWRNIDAQLAQAKDLNCKVVAGPLFTLHPRDLPEWVFVWEDDFNRLRNDVANYAANVVRRYAGNVQVWYATSRMITGQGLDLDDEQRLQLAADVISVIRDHDPQTPIVLGFDQPWAEYLAQRDCISPFHFVDTLVRNNLPIAGVALNLDLGYWPGGSGLRDILDISNQLDRWSIFGLPLLVYLTAPTSNTPDSAAFGAANAIEPCPWVDQHLQPLQEILHLLISKPTVHALLWNAASDALEHEYERSGVFDANGDLKKVFKVWSSLKLAHGL